MIGAPLLASIGLAALAAALAYQFWGGPWRGYAVRRRRAGFALIALMALLGLVQLMTGSRAAGGISLIERLTAPAIDGSWAAVSIDGVAPPEGMYTIHLRRGAVAGGYDDCNSWSYDTENAPPGERLIVTTLVGCPEDDPLRRGYWLLVNRAGDRPESIDPRTLRLAADGHQAIFRPCRYPPRNRGGGIHRCELEE